MKPYVCSIAFIVLVLVFVSARYQNENAQKATIKVIDNVEIYMQCEPLREYKVVGDVLPAGMNMHMDSMDHLCEHFINRARKKYAGAKFDGIIFQNNWRASIIQFNEK